MFSQLWSGVRTREYQAVRDLRRRKRAYRPGIESLNERCLLSASVVPHFDQAVPAPVGVGAAPALVASTIRAPKPAPSGGVAKAAIPKPSNNPGASSSATNGGAASTSSSLASSTGPTFSEITEVSPSLFAAPLTTTAPPAAGAPPTAQSAVNPFVQSSAPAPAPAPFAGQALLVSQVQVLRSARLSQEDGFVEGGATGAPVDEKQQAEPCIKIIEKPKATAPTYAPEQRPEQAPAPKPVPILPEKGPERVLDNFDYALLSTLFETGASRPESAPEEPDSSPGFWAMLGASALSTGALPLAISVPNQSRGRRAERRQHSKLPDL